MPRVDLDELELLAEKHGWKRVGPEADLMLWLADQLKGYEEVCQERNGLEVDLAGEQDRVGELEEQIEQLEGKLAEIRDLLITDEGAKR